MPDSTISLGDRMKTYERASERYLTRRVPLQIRLDGNCFHTWTRGLKRPFDDALRSCMEYAAYTVCSEISGAVFAYTQSDEISIAVIDYQSHNTEAWFDYRANKIESVSASICTAAFNQAAMKYLPENYDKKGPAYFDSRAFSMPADDVVNLFIWRQRDCEKNSVSSVAQAHFSDKELHGKNSSDKQDMLMLQKGVNWNDVPTRYKRGVALYKVRLQLPNPYKPEEGLVIRNKWVIDYEMPVLSKDPAYMSKWLIPGTVVDGVPFGCMIMEQIKNQPHQIKEFLV